MSNFLCLLKMKKQSEKPKFRYQTFDGKFQRFLNDLENYSQSLCLMLNSKCLSEDENNAFSAQLQSIYLFSCWLKNKVHKLKVSGDLDVDFHYNNYVE